MNGPTPEALTEAARVIRGCTGFSLPAVDVAGILASDRLLAAAISEYGSSDTLVREDLMDAVMIRLVGRAWPTFGEERGMGKDAYAKLMESLRQAAIRRGWLDADAKWGIA